jgi:PUB domain
MELRNAESIIDEVVAAYNSIREGGDTEWQRSLVALSFSDVAKTTTTTTTTTTTSDGAHMVQDTKNVAKETTTANLSATTALHLLVTIKNQLIDIRPLMDKFLKRLNEKDPITEKPRYGSQTAQRVQKLVNQYKELACVILHETFGTSTTDIEITETASKTSSSIINNYNSSNSAALEILKNLASQEEMEQKQREHNEMMQRQQQEDERRASEERINQERRRVEDEDRRQIELVRNELAEQARAIRDATIHAHREESRRDREWVLSIPNKKTIIGVRTQLDILLASTATTLVDQYKAIQALNTIFGQIVSHPEQVNFRRIRRDHPQFLADIGRHDGGRELLIAAGFELGFVDEVPSFVCKEPNIETDLDGWSSWFDLLKDTVNVLAEQKKK